MLMSMIRRVAALALLLLPLGACSSGGDSSREKTEQAKVDPEMLRQYARNLQQYIDAMLMCGSLVPADWEEAKKQFALLNPFLVFKEDPQLIREFTAGSESARKELARRGMILRSVYVFSTGTYDRVK